MTIIFKPHPVGEGVQALKKITSRISLSIIGGEHFYGDGVSTFEVALLIDDEIHGNVIGWQSMKEVKQLIKLIKQFH